MVSDLLQRSFFILIMAITAPKDLLVEAAFYAVSSGAFDIHPFIFYKKVPKSLRGRLTTTFSPNTMTECLSCYCVYGLFSLLWVTVQLANSLRSHLTTNASFVTLWTVFSHFSGLLWIT